VIDVVEPNGQVRRLPIVAVDEVPRALRAAFDALGPPDPSGHGVEAQVLRTEKPILAAHVTEQGLAGAARDEQHLTMLRAAKLRSSLLVPLVARDTVLGAMTLLTTAASERTFSSSDLELAEELARRAAQALDHARLYAAERTARTEAQRAVGARDEFLSVAAHELRTPVTALKATAQFLLRTQARGALDTERLLRLLQSIDQQSSRLAVLTNDLLDVSRLRTGHVQLEPRLVDLPALMRGIVQRHQDHLGAEHTLTLRLEEPACPVLVDPDRFEQVVVNLLSNAVKYTPAGGPIEVSLDAQEGGVLLAVRDCGIGLPPGSSESIFEPFGRASNAARRQIQGMGLGLHISREIVQRHGGRIWASSRGEDQGTTLSVWLPCGDKPPPST
jgi:signal transduction histidine kinase